MAILRHNQEPEDDKSSIVGKVRNNADWLNCASVCLSQRTGAVTIISESNQFGTLNYQTNVIV